MKPQESQRGEMGLCLSSSSLSVVVRLCVLVIRDGNMHVCSVLTYAIVKEKHVHAL
jgi:hypothetical protein